MLRGSRRTRGDRSEALRPAAPPQAARSAVRAAFLAHGDSCTVTLAPVVTAVAVADAVGPRHRGEKNNGSQRSQYSQYCLPQAIGERGERPEGYHFGAHFSSSTLVQVATE